LWIVLGGVPKLGSSQTRGGPFYRNTGQKDTERSPAKFVGEFIPMDFVTHWLRNGRSLLAAAFSLRAFCGDALLKRIEKSKCSSSFR
jgi:hypothetical protein